MCAVRRQCRQADGGQLCCLDKGGVGSTEQGLTQPGTIWGVRWSWLPIWQIAINPTSLLQASQAVSDRSVVPHHTHTICLHNRGSLTALYHPTSHTHTHTTPVRTRPSLRAEQPGCTGQQSTSSDALPVSLTAAEGSVCGCCVG